MNDDTDLLPPDIAAPIAASDDPFEFDGRKRRKRLQTRTDDSAFDVIEYATKRSGSMSKRRVQSATVSNLLALRARRRQVRLDLERLDARIVAFAMASQLDPYKESLRQALRKMAKQRRELIVLRDSLRQLHRAQEDEYMSHLQPSDALEFGVFDDEDDEV